ncbi:MAG: class I SAM-dependent methyltransferase [Chloroflexota bacterium]
MTSYRRLAELYSRQPAAVRLYVRLRLGLRLLKANEFAELLPADGVILDCGCGYGLLANYLALDSDSRQVVGIDSDPARIAVAQATAFGRPNTSFRTGDLAGADLPMARGAVMTDFLHHLPYHTQSQVLGSVVRALEPEGILLIREVNPAHSPRWKYWCSVAAELLMYPRPGTVKLQNRQPDDLARELRALGLAVTYRQVDRGSPFAAIMYECRKHA